MSLALYRDLIPAHADPVASDTTVQIWLNQATLRLDAPCFGVLFDTAVVWFAAHLFETDPGGGATNGAANSGPVSSQRLEDLAVAYGIPTSGLSAADYGYLATSYGRNFLQIRDTRACAMPTFVAVC